MVKKSQYCLIALYLLTIWVVPEAEGGVGAGSGCVEVSAMFTPGEDIAGRIVDEIGLARHQVMVQAYTFTHAGIAQALVAARGRGVEVDVIADRAQALLLPHHQLGWLSQHGVNVALDGEHQIAHSKVILIDAEHDSPVVISGSFNLTRAAQEKNAENAVFIRGDRVLAQRYIQQWRQHWAHAQRAYTAKAD